jgi:RNA polymerase sigma-70 factor (ECF subfamily)
MDTPPDRAAWIQSAMERYERRLIAYAMRFTGDSERARDVVQETFLRLCAAERAKVQERLAAWLYTVCRNRALDVVRKEHRMQPMSERIEAAIPDRAPPLAVAAERKQQSTRVRDLLETLPDAHREVIRLKFQDDLSYKKISEITGHSVANVGYLIHTAVGKLREGLRRDERASARRRQLGGAR